MMPPSSDSRGLAGLMQLSIESELQPKVRYRIERRIGEGALGIAFLALRDAPEGTSPVVIKVIKPQIVIGMGATASLIVRKEAVALGRLNETVPPTPFVVRFIDTGTAPLYGTAHPSLPWIAVEYVHGGVEGTTLDERLQHSKDTTGFAFDPVRAAHLVRCLASGLSAIHAVGVIHRDLNPNNVLCCGFGEAEIFKISDFGIARPGGMQMTFGDAQLGTIGYAAPEQGNRDGPGVDTYTDVFSFACVVFYALTGESYFDHTNPVRAMLTIQSPSRRSLRSSQWLYPELRDRPDACEAIDHALARASSVKPLDRPASAEQLGAILLPWLAPVEQPPKPSRRRVVSLMGLSSPAQVSSWTWTVRHAPGDDRVIRCAGWEADGRCLTATSRGLEFWDGTAWAEVSATSELPTILFTRRFASGRWLIGGADGMLAVLAGQHVRDFVRAPDLSVTFSDANGRFDDLLVAVGHRPDRPPELWAMAARRWMRPLPLGGVAFVSVLLPIDDSRWLICGRLDEGGAFVALYTPMLWEATMLAREAVRAFVSGASQAERGLVLVVGTEGSALRFEGDRATSSIVEGRPDLTAGAIDLLDREWVASAGALWFRDPERDPRWQSVWREPRWAVPVVGLMADAGLVLAMTADGGIVEGRAPWRA